MTGREVPRETQVPRSQERPAGPRVEVGGGATGGRPHTSWEAQRLSTQGSHG